MIFQFFVAQILSGLDDDGDYEIKFIKSSSKIKQGFHFPEVHDLASAKRSDIALLLESPTPISTTKRLAGVFKFVTNLSRYMGCKTITDACNYYMIVLCVINSLVLTSYLLKQKLNV